MFTECVSCFRFCNKLLRTQLGDVSDADAIPSEGHKAPRWIVGHLAVGNWYACRFLGLADAHPIPDEWAAAFSPGTPSEPPYGLDDGAAFPGLDDLMAYLAATEQPIVDAAAALPAGSLGEPHGVELLDGTGIDTQADLVAHLMTSHYAFHLGQLSIWRRANGVTPLF